MKKILLLILGLSILGGMVFALVPGLFPDTANFPRIPTGEGTIGKALTIILGKSDLTDITIDGEVVNSFALSGVTASGYLKNDASCPTGQKFVGIDIDGKRLCGATTTLLTDYGKILTQDCPAEYYRIDDSQGTTGTGDTLISGDIVRTLPGCTLTIVFTDESILRLDGDTTVALDLGSLADGTTIASAILKNGSLWGRILTETGSYSIGTDVIIVGVRGTSVAITSTGNTISITNTGSGWGVLRVPTPNNTLIDVVDSRLSTGPTVHCVNRYTQVTQSLGTLDKNKFYSINPLGCDDILPVVTTVPKSTRYLDLPWVRKNTRKDIEYMYGKRLLSGAVMTVSKRNLIRDEILATIPELDLSGDLTPLGSMDSLSLCENGERWWNERYGCQPEKVLAIADFALPEEGICPVNGIVLSFFPARLPAHHKCTTGYSGTLLPGRGVRIGINDYIKFDSGSISAAIGGFSGKNFTFELEEYNGGANNYIFYFGPYHYLAYLNAINYEIITLGSPTAATATLYGAFYKTSRIRGDKLGGNIVPESNLIKQFIIGNSSVGTAGLKGILKNIKIIGP